MIQLLEELYHKIKHGNADHKEWLWNEMEEFSKNYIENMATLETLKEQNYLLTEGQKAVGITFNPGGMPEVNKIKEVCATVIDVIEELKANAVKDNNGEKIAQLILAKRKIQEGQMWAVKAVTWQY